MQEGVDAVGPGLDGVLDAAVHVAVDRVNAVVVGADPAGGRGVEVAQRVEAAAQHLTRAVGHAGEVVGDLQLGRVSHGERAIRHVLGQVADPLEVVVDLEDRHDEPQVARHRLVEGEHLEALLLQFDLEAVHDVVRVEDAPGQRHIALGHRAHGQPERLLHGAADVEQALLQVVGLDLQVPGHGRRSSPPPGAAAGAA